MNERALASGRRPRNRAGRPRLTRQPGPILRFLFAPDGEIVVFVSHRATS